MQHELGDQVNVLSYRKTSRKLYGPTDIMLCGFSSKRILHAVNKYINVSEEQKWKQYLGKLKSLRCLCFW